MRLNVVLRYVGLILLLDAAFMLLSVVVSLLGGMDTGFYPLLQSFVLTAILGAFPLIFVPRGGQITSKEGYAIVVGAWLMSCLAGMLPYVLWGGEFSVSDAWFEAVSGFTTTGSTSLSNVEALPRGLLFWRASTHWLGGVGVVMFCRRWDRPRCACRASSFRPWPRIISATGRRKSCRFCWSSMSV